MFSHSGIQCKAVIIPDGAIGLKHFPNCVNTRILLWLEVMKTQLELQTMPFVKQNCVKEKASVCFSGKTKLSPEVQVTAL